MVPQQASLTRFPALNLRLILRSHLRHAALARAIRIRSLYCRSADLASITPNHVRELAATIRLNPAFRLVESSPDRTITFLRRRSSRDVLNPAFR